MRSPATSPVMVGRDQDLAVLNEAHLTTLSGAPRAVVVAGEAGIGKTRLITEFLGALGDGVVVARGQCVAMGSLGTPFGPVRGVLRDLVDHLGASTVLEAAGPAGHLLAALLADLGPEGDPAAEVAQEQLHDIVGRLLSTLSRDRPLVVVVEDLHWADVATLDLVRALLATLRDGRLLVVLTYRTDDVGRDHPLRPVLAELGRNRGVARLELRRLRAEEAAELVRLIRGERPDPNEVELLVERSEGVPFFVEELLLLDAADGGALPDTLRELVLARYVRLGEPTQAVLRLIAAGGVSVEHALVEQVHEGDGEAFEAAVREAIAAQVLGADGTSYSFRHALTQEAVHGELLPGERARFHARYAAVLADHPDLAGSTAEVAHHWLEAHDLPRAFRASVAAAHEARAAGAPAGAGRLGERALELWPRVPDAATLAGCEKADLFLVTAQAYDEAGDRRALAILDEALAETPRDDRRRYALLLHETMAVWHAHGKPGGGRLVEEALDLLPEDGDDEDRVVRLRVLCGLGIHYLFARSETARGAEVLRQAVGLGRQLLSRRASPDVAERARFELARALTNLGSCCADQGDLDGAFAALDEALVVAGDDPNARLRDAERRTQLLACSGRYVEARDLGLSAHSLAQDVGQERGWGLSIALSVVSAHLALGELREAELFLDRIRTMRPWAFVSAYESVFRAELHLLRDEVDAAREVIADHRSLQDTVADSDAEDALVFAAHRARVALAGGDVAAAWAEVSTLWSTEMDLPGPAYVLPVIGARVLAAMRRAGTSPEDLPEAEVERRLRATFDRLPEWDVAPLWRSLLVAELSGPEGTGTDAAAWRDAVEAAGGGRLPVSEHAHAVYRLGAVQAAAGDRADAAETLAGAAEVAAGAGLLRISRLVDEQVSLAGLERRSRGAGEQHSLELTAREQQVLALVARGLTNRQIGERLFISDKTASVHVSAILRKLGAASRTEAAVRAAALGLTANGPAS